MQKKNKTAENYATASRVFKQFLSEHPKLVNEQTRSKEIMPIEKINHSLIQSFEQWLIEKRGCMRNSSSAYLRNLRAVYNQAVEDEICSDNRHQKEYESALHLYNSNLSRISSIAGLSHPITSYSARHSWATQAFKLKIPIKIISSCMGHTSERTTRIYLEQLKENELDRKCRIVIRQYEDLLTKTICKKH